MGEKYTYNFDLEIMHKYMFRSFFPFLRKGNLLELGSGKGDFTRRLLQYYDDITCVEKDEASLVVAISEFQERVKYVQSSIEDAILPTKYDNVIMTHVLEHIVDPIAILKRVKEEWISDYGRLLIACPNANAPSRQIAVKMGLISHNAAITSDEVKHGHKITYSFDTLERDVREAGLKIIYRSGIFFKALSNFQYDELLKTNIVSAEYFEGCYKFGQEHPDMCASIFLVCKA
jgi:2-polyprenyl-3-methyl-5-hydroxy-6-metoxy-1,4-benzoquinol methylase